MFVQTDEPSGPFCAKSVADICIDGVAPAIASAIHNATGIWMRQTALYERKGYGCTAAGEVIACWQGKNHTKAVVAMIGGLLLIKCNKLSEIRKLINSVLFL
jgi:hypothetical protein